MNKKPLLIVESPSKAKTIAKYLGGEVDVLACVGHVKDLPRKELGVDVDNDFQITLKVLPDRKSFIKKLKSLARVAPKVILATDPDREGEAIADHLASEIPEARIERVQFTEITRSGVSEGMKHGRPLNRHLVDAQRTRRIIDRLVGYKISPLLWNTLQKNMKFVKTALSAGRVQSAAVKIIIDRERLRASFKASTYFDLKAELAKSGGAKFFAELFQLDGKRIAQGRDFDKNTGALANQNVLLLTESQATALVDELMPGTWEVTSIEEKPQTSKPRPPFTTSTLQQEAARKFRFSARRTMITAQKLYEAGFITYMRTDSTNLSTEALNAARNEIRQRFGDEYLPARPVQYVTKVKNAQEAHEAIRPAGSQFSPVEAALNTLGKDAGRLYELIWKRTIASQMKPAKIKQTTILITNQKAVFRARGKVITFPGYMRVYVESQDDADSKKNQKELVLPEVKTGDELECLRLNAEEHTTKPPPRFTEATLVKEMETKGIGRPSTYASILDTIQRRDYVINQNGTLIPTFLAVAVTQLLENHFSPLVDVKFTARMEDSLDAIARGELKPLPFMNDFYFGSEKTLGLEQMLDTQIDIRKACTIPIINNRGEPILARIGNYGPYLQKGETRRSIPFNLALGDLTPEKARELLENNEARENRLGTDPETGQPVLLKVGPYGPYVQLGDTQTRKSIPKDIRPEELTLAQALDLLSLPRSLGCHPETGEEVLADYGRYGPYIRMGKKNARLTPPLTPLTITLEEALTLLSKKAQRSTVLHTIGAHPETGEELVVKEGRYGPFITDGKVNAAVPKGINPDQISLPEAVKLINERRAAGPKKRRRRKK